MIETTIGLGDGRFLGFTEWGDPKGIPVFFFHGTPGSRKMRHPRSDIAESLKVRIIAVDRPGYGLSDPLPKRSFLDWPADVACLADRLGIDNFRIAAFSGGGPYALACAHLLGPRVEAVALMNSVGPIKTCASEHWNWPIQFGLRASQFAPWLLKLVVNRALAKAKQDFDRYFVMAVSKLPDCDQEILLRDDIRVIFKESLTEAFRNGISTFLWEVRLLTGPWGFFLQEITQPVALWHGDQDPFSNGVALASMLPNCRATILPEGHLVFFTHWTEILNQLISM